ncbi:NUDIX hydrolase [Pseudoxanthomonas daejeonensis]|nr:NUDIX hydrolase [Pseudoxanthomonas daejeonensis]UNK57316.1 NUDIX hydrolase [Pseudoxanthomonas daejeonensis]
MASLPVRDWHPDVTVASVIARDGRLLLVEERIEGRLVLNQPAGHLEPGETLAEGAVRETLEETGWEIAVEAFIGTYQWTAPGGQQYLRFAFAGRAVAHDPSRRLDEGIERAVWLTPAELRARAGDHRSPLVWQVAADWLAGRRHPLSLVQAL